MPNIALVAPFFFAIGIAIYFGLSSEPIVAYPAIISALLAANLFRIKNYYARIVLFAVLGFFYSIAWTQAVHVETATRPWRDIMVQGTVSRISYAHDRTRVFIPNAITDKDTRPMTVRITLAKGDVKPNVGDTINVRATLLRPQPPDSPGAFDFAKWSYFNRIGASGFAQENHRVLKQGGKAGFFQKLRNDIHTNIAANASREATWLADSLVLGHSRAMSREEAERIRAAGLAHVFSISGLHMTVIGGWIFIIFNFLFKLATPLTRRIPSAKFAAVATWLCLIAYLLISGAGIATTRAFAMASLGFLALIAGRRALSLRILCLCMFGLLLLRPHYALEAGFQMSFAAVFGLIYFFGGQREYIKRTRMQKFGRLFYLAFMTSLISSIFTMPFIAHHFRAIAIYGEIGNLLCLSIFSFLILPLTLFGTIASLFGYFGLLELGAHAYRFTYEIITYISEMPNSLVYIPSIPGWTLAVMALGAAFMLLVKERIRWIAAAPIILSIIYIFAKPYPILYASRDRQVVALMTDSGNLRFNMPRSPDNPFAISSWSGLNAEPFPKREMRRAFGKGFGGEKYSLRCIKTSDTCIYTTPKWTAAIVLRFVGLVHNLDYLCENTDYIISHHIIDYPECKAKIINEMKPLVIYKSGRIKFAKANRHWHNPPQRNTVPRLGPSDPQPDERSPQEQNSSQEASQDQYPPESQPYF